VPQGLTAVQAEKDSGNQVKIVTLNMTKDLVDPIRTGQILSTVDQQGWLQGYEAVDSLWLNKINGNTLGSGQAVLTGPTLVNKDNIDTVAGFIEQGTR
jgi:simple sugar transport system substrate-binding protein